MNGMQIRFGEASPVQRLEIGFSESPTKGDIQPFLDSLKLRAEEVASFRYKDQPMTLHNVWGTFSVRMR